MRSPQGLGHMIKRLAELTKSYCHYLRKQESWLGPSQNCELSFFWDGMVLKSEENLLSGNHTGEAAQTCFGCIIERRREIPGEQKGLALHLPCPLFSSKKRSH